MFEESVKHSADIRIYNKKRIIDLLRDGSKTKKQLADALGISIATASSLCNVLEQEGYLLSVSTKNSEGGRIPQQYMLCSNFCCVICLNVVERDIITLAVTDLCGDVLCQEHIGSKQCATAQELMTFSADCIRQMIDALSFQMNQVIGIGLAISGNEMEQSHTIQNSSGNPLLNDANIRSVLEREFPGMPIYIENEANEAALALYHKEHIQRPELEDIVYLYIGDGVGVGIISGGQLLRGAHGVGGEINHIQLGHRGYRCYCGRENCLETEISVVGFQQKFFSDSGIQHPINRYGWDIMEDAVRKDDPVAMALIEENGRLIGKAISILCQIFDAPICWIGGFDSYIYERLYPYIIEEVDGSSLFNHLFHYQVRFDDGFHNIITKGCYERVFQDWLPLGGRL